MAILRGSKHWSGHGPLHMVAVTEDTIIIIVNTYLPHFTAVVSEDMINCSCMPEVIEDATVGHVYATLYGQRQCTSFKVCCTQIILILYTM